MSSEPTRQQKDEEAERDISEDSLMHSDTSTLGADEESNGDSSTTLVEVERAGDSYSALVENEHTTSDGSFGMDYSFAIGAVLSSIISMWIVL